MSTKGGSVLVAVALLLAVNVSAGDRGEDSHHRDARFIAKLKPTEEVPAISSRASGWFKLTIDEANQSLWYELSYEGLEGTALQAHIHVGQRRVSGGISVWLCGTAPEGFPEAPACPESGTVSGLITPAHITGPVNQGIEATAMEAHEFDELVRMIRRGLTYANVHSSRFPPGEIRGQIVSSANQR
jgi:hypothetical protein